MGKKEMKLFAVRFNNTKCRTENEKDLIEKEDNHVICGVNLFGDVPKNEDDFVLVAANIRDIMYSPATNVTIFKNVNKFDKSADEGSVADIIIETLDEVYDVVRKNEGNEDGKEFYIKILVSPETPAIVLGYLINTISTLQDRNYGVYCYIFN